MLLTANKKLITKYHEWFYTKPYSQVQYREEFYTKDAYIQEQYGVDWIRITEGGLGVDNNGVVANDIDATHFSDYYGAYIDTPDIPPTPQRDYETYETRQTENSTIALDTYKDIEINIPVISFNYDLMNNDAQYNLIAFNNFIKSGTDLVTSQSTEYYYKIKQIAAYEWSHVSREKYKTTIKFTCSPFKYKADESLIYIDCTNNEEAKRTGGVYTLSWGNCNSFPLLRLDTPGNTEGRSVTVYINDVSFSLTGITSDPLFVDCETCEVYRISGGEKVLEYSDLAGGYPTPQMKIGQNTISINGLVRLTVKPRERFI